MKWKTNWWGVTLWAENAEDADLIRKLVDRLPNEPVESYEGGDLEIEFIDTNAATIVFNR